MFFVAESTIIIAGAVTLKINEKQSASMRNQSEKQ